MEQGQQTDENVIPGAGETTQWFMQLVVQPRGRELGSQNPHEKPGMVLCALVTTALVYRHGDKIAGVCWVPYWLKEHELQVQKRLYLEE